MATISYPTKNSVKYFADNTIYLRADSGTVTQYCTEGGLTLSDYVAETQRFSNDGGLAYAYYGPFTGVIGPNGLTGTTTMWQVEWGYSKIVTELIYT